MDILSHGLWGFLILKKMKPRIQFLAAFIFNLLPDIIPFGMMIIFMIFTGNISYESFSPETLPPFVFITYKITHSFFTFMILFLLFYIIKKHIFWPILGLLIHIIIDIPTHGDNDYITTFLYPFSDYAFDGLRWTNSYIISINFLVLGILYFLSYRKQSIKVDTIKLNKMAWKILLIPSLFFTLPYIFPLFKPDLYLESYLLDIANVSLAQINSFNPKLLTLLKLLFRMGSSGILCLSIISTIILLTGFRNNLRGAWYALIPTWVLFWSIALGLDFSLNAGIYQYIYSGFAIALVIIAGVFSYKGTFTIVQKKQKTFDQYHGLVKSK